MDDSGTEDSGEKVPGKQKARKKSNFSIPNGNNE